MTDTSFHSPPSPVLGVAEIALNRHIGQDRRALQRCAALAGRALQVNFSDLRLTITFIAETHGIQIRGRWSDQADVRLTGRAAAFSRAVFSAGSEGIVGAGLQIEGDVGVAQQFADLFAGLDFDIADVVDAHLGPVPAHFIGRGVAHARAFFKRAADELPAQTAEYLREETEDVIGTWEYEGFAREVEQTRDAVDRLAARVQRLDT